MRGHLDMHGTIPGQGAHDGSQSTQEKETPQGTDYHGARKGGKCRIIAKQMSTKWAAREDRQDPEEAEPTEPSNEVAHQNAAHAKTEVKAKGNTISLQEPPPDGRNLGSKRQPQVPLLQEAKESPPGAATHTAKTELHVQDEEAVNCSDEETTRKHSAAAPHSVAEEGWCAERSNCRTRKDTGGPEAIFSIAGAASNQASLESDDVWKSFTSLTSADEDKEDNAVGAAEDNGTTEKSTNPRGCSTQEVEYATWPPTKPKVKASQMPAKSV